MRQRHVVSARLISISVAEECLRTEGATTKAAQIATARSCEMRHATGGAWDMLVQRTLAPVGSLDCFP